MDCVKKYDLIAVEDLKIKNMIKNKHLSKSIADASWGMFVQQLENKSEETLKQVIKVDPKNTTKQCSSCGNIQEIKLSTRVYNCEKCGMILDRDLNAAINILARAELADAKCSNSYNLSAKHA